MIRKNCASERVESTSDILPVVTFTTLPALPIPLDHGRMLAGGDMFVPSSKLPLSGTSDFFRDIVYTLQ
eukprot:s2812_g2.t1